MPEVSDPFRPAPEARQFSLRRVMLLVFLCAVIGGTGQALDLSPTAQAVFTFWWMALAAYLVFRLPYVILTLLGRTSGQKRLKAHRAELEEVVAQKRRELSENRHGGPT